MRRSWITRIRKGLARYRFVFGVLAVLGAGALAGPAAAAWNPGGLSVRAAVVLLFLITGLTLDTSRILHDLSNPRLHLFIQGFIFVLCPLVFLTAVPLFGKILDGNLSAGILALAVLPTTIASGTVLTHAAYGNTAAAAFNAALSNLVGIFLSPVLLSLLLAGSSRSLPPESLKAVLNSLLMTMFVPLVAGQVLRLKLASALARRRLLLGRFSGGLILGIIFFAFASAVGHSGFRENLRFLPWPLAYLALSHVALLVLAFTLSGWLRFPGPDRLAVVFVAPQKTLAMGIPMLTLFFGDSEALGIMMLPVIFYHPFQLLAAGVLQSLPVIRRLADRP